MTLFRLKVLVVTPWYPAPDQPARGTFVRAQARAASLYDDVTVLHLAGTDRAPRGVWRLESDADPARTESLPTYRLWTPRVPLVPAAYPSQFAGVLAACRRFGPQVIQAHVFAAGLPAVFAGRARRLPVVLTEHYSGFLLKTLRPLDRVVARLAFGLADRVLPVSRALQGAIEDYGIKARFEVVPNAVDTDCFSPAPPPDPAGGPKRLLFVGSLEATHLKGVPVLLAALAQVRARRGDWRLEIVGDGPARPGYEQLAADLGLAPLVTFHGQLRAPEVAEQMRRCAFLVLPSAVETFGVVLIEALASGRPVIATANGGAAEFIGPDQGLIVPPGDAAALAAAIERMLDHSAEYPPDRLSTYAREHFGYLAVGARLDRIYREALAAHGTNRPGSGGRP